MPARIVAVVYLPSSGCPHEIAAFFEDDAGVRLLVSKAVARIEDRQDAARRRDGLLALRDLAGRTRGLPVAVDPPFMLGKAEDWTPADPPERFREPRSPPPAPSR